MSKHTPGPEWQMDDEVTFHYRIPSDRASKRDRELDIRVRGAGLTPDMALAAPELLEALQMVVSDLQELGELTVQSAAAVDKAMAKARGIS